MWSTCAHALRACTHAAAQCTVCVVVCVCRHMTAAGRAGAAGEDFVLPESAAGVLATGCAARRAGTGSSCSVARAQVFSRVRRRVACGGMRVACPAAAPVAAELAGFAPHAQRLSADAGVCTRRQQQCGCGCGGRRARAALLRAWSCCGLGCTRFVCVAALLAHPSCGASTSVYIRSDSQGPGLGGGCPAAGQQARNVNLTRRSCCCCWLAGRRV